MKDLAQIKMDNEARADQMLARLGAKKERLSVLADSMIIQANELLQIIKAGETGSYLSGIALGLEMKSTKLANLTHEIVYGVSR